LYAYHENAFGDYFGNDYPGSASPGGLRFFAYHVNTTSYAGFGSLNLDISDKLHVTLGGRYTIDKKAQPENLVAPSTTVKKFSPRATFRYDWTDDFNTYFSYSKAFRSGNYSSVYTNPALPPENLTSYEVGAKYQNRNARFNISAFYYDYTDLQLATFTGINATLSSATATLYGVDFDGEWQFSDHFRIRGGGSYLPEAKYNDYQNAIVFAVTPQFPVVTYDGTTTCGNYCGIKQQVVDASGFRMIKAPKFTGFMGLNFENELTAGKITANLSGYYTSSVRYDFIGFMQQKAYVTFGADVSFAPAAMPGLKIGAFAKNINNAYFLNGFNISAAQIHRYHSPPPELGLRLGYEF
jgi:iron complex outermembrane receptor protein